MVAPIDLAMLLLKQGEFNDPRVADAMAMFNQVQERKLARMRQEQMAQQGGAPYNEPPLYPTGGDPGRDPNPWQQPPDDSCTYCNGTGRAGGGGGGGPPPMHPDMLGDESIEHLEWAKEQGYHPQYDPAGMGFTPEAIARVQAQNDAVRDSWK